MLNKFITGISRAGNSALQRLASILSGKKALTAEELREMERLLLMADVGHRATQRLLTALGQNGSDVPAMERLKQGMIAIFQSGNNNKFDPLTAAAPQVWLISGVNGSGKTTTVGKLGCRLSSEGHRVMMAAADTYRAAAQEQLEIWAKRAGSEIVGSIIGADPAAVAYDAVAAAKSRQVDYLLIDTAGRLHNRKHLQEELSKIHRSIGKCLPGAPHLSLLVMDATTGQSGLSQAKLFSESIRIDGLVLTKLDGTAKGGIVLAIAQELEIPVLWVGLGEQAEDLQPFDPEEFVNGLLGQGNH